MAYLSLIVPRIIFLLCLSASARSAVQAPSACAHGRWEAEPDRRLTSQTEVDRLAESFPDQRADLCDSASRVRNNSISLPDALRGAQLTVAWVVTESADPDMYFYDAASGKYSGYMIDILDEFSKVAGFTYTVNRHPRNESISWTGELLRTLLPSHDLIIVWFAHTPERARLHFKQLHPFFDVSMQSITQYQVRELTVLETIFSFTRPLHASSWGALGAALVVTGVMYYILERGSNADDIRDDESPLLGILRCVVLSFFQTTGAGGFSPKTWPGRIVVASFGWMILLLVAAYTANLASFFVARGGSLIPFTGIEDAVNKNVPICTPEKGAVVAQTIFNLFPTFQNFTSSERPENGLRDNQCQVAVLPKFRIDLAMTSKSLNPTCKMIRIGQSLNVLQGGWMLLDSGPKCTSLIHDVFAFYALDFERRGFFKDKYAEFVGRKADQSCSEPGTDDDESAALTWASLSGVFMVHFFLVGVAFISKMSLSFGKKAVKRMSSSIALSDQGPEQNSEVRPTESLGQDAAELSLARSLEDHVRQPEDAHVVLGQIRDAADKLGKILEVQRCSRSLDSVKSTL